MGRNLVLIPRFSKTGTGVNEEVTGTLSVQIKIKGNALQLIIIQLVVLPYAVRGSRQHEPISCNNSSRTSSIIGVFPTSGYLNGPRCHVDVEQFAIVNCSRGRW